MQRQLSPPGIKLERKSAEHAEVYTMTFYRERLLEILARICKGFLVAYEFSRQAIVNTRLDRFFSRYILGYPETIMKSLRGIRIGNRAMSIMKPSAIRSREPQKTRNTWKYIGSSFVLSWLFRSVRLKFRCSRIKGIGC